MRTPTIRDASQLPSLITLVQLQELFGVSRCTAIALTKRPGFPTVRIGHRTIRISRDELFKWMDKHTRVGELWPAELPAD
jgi:predicted DNA-binding transcriptional regulator AlpA